MSANRPLRQCVRSCCGLVLVACTINTLPSHAQAQGLLNRLEERVKERITGQPAAQARPDNRQPDSSPLPPLTLGMEAEERGRAAPFEVVVVSVRRQSSAANAGIVPGDVIASIDGNPVGTIDEIAAAMALKKPGDSMPLQIRRGNRMLELVADFGPAVLPAEPTVERPRPGSGRLGVTVENAATTPPGPGVPVQRGAVVVGVAPGSPADKAGIQPGNVIVSLNGAVIQEAASLIEAISQTLPGQEIELTFYRAELLLRSKVTLAAPLGSAPLTPLNSEPDATSAVEDSPREGKRGGLLGGLSGALGGLLGNPRETDSPPSLALPPLPETGRDANGMIEGGAELLPPTTQDAPPAASAAASAATLRAEIAALRKQLEALEKRLIEIEP